MAREKKVVDASVIAKWFLNEFGTDKALELRKEHISGKSIILVPELTFIEVLNALRYKGNNEKKIKCANEALWETQLHVEKTNEFILQEAISLSIKYDLSLYDAIYVALAQLHGCQLVTADKKLSKVPNTVLI